TISLSGSVSVASGGYWFSSGSGTFTPGANNLDVVYAPSASDKASGKITLVLTTTGNGNCLAASDTVELIITPKPTTDAGPDQVVCSNNPVVSLTGVVTTATGGAWSGGTGLFSAGANSLVT